MKNWRSVRNRMSDEIVIEENKATFSKKRIFRREIIRETVTIEEIEIPDTKPIVKTISFEPMSHARSAISLCESLESTSIDDSECRKELARLLDIQELPTRNPDAFAELDGLFDDIIQLGEKVDVTKWVRSVRKRK